MRLSGLEKILVYLETTEGSIQACEYAVCLAKATGAELAIVHVVDVKTLEELLKARILVQMEEIDHEQHLEEDGKRYLDHARDLAEAKGVSVETFLEKGEVRTEVLKKVEELAIDLLVMEEPELPKRRRDYYYNEAERIFRDAPCSVLVVKGGDATREMYEAL